MTRVIHTGDTHLGYQQYHVPDRREDFLAAFRRVVEDAVADDVDAVVHAGDLFHDRRPTLTDVLGTLDVLRTLDDAGVPFLAIVGNHEAKRDAQWLDLFESLDLATRLDDGPHVVGDTAFYGMDYVPRSKRDALEYEFEPHDADHAAIVSHGLFQPFDHGTWDARTVLAESSVDFDAMLLGDDHQADTAEVEDTWLTYCGSTERAAADERADRSYNLVTFDGDVQISRRGLETREFVFVDVDLGPAEGVERVRERVGQYDLEDAVVVVHVDGEGDPVTPASVEEFALDRDALVARVTDHREFADEREVEVSFADPDEAVRERVRELGLSEAARDIDETIRASKVADSNVAEEVESRVRNVLDEGEPSVFEDAPDDEPGENPEAVPDDAPEAAAADGGDDADVAGAGGADGAGTAAESAPAEQEADDGAADQHADDTEPGTSTQSESVEGDGQASMEEYL